MEVDGIDDGARAELLPGLRSSLRSSPTAKQLRFDLVDDASGEGSGVLAVSIDEAKSGVKLVITHEKLPTIAAADVWKSFWGDWITELELPG